MRYANYSGIDSPHAADGDMAFVKWISRLNPEELGKGDVATSTNGRMEEGRTWRTRLGTDRIVDSPDLWCENISASTAAARSLGAYTDVNFNWIFLRTSDGVVAQNAKTSGGTIADRQFLYLPESASSFITGKDGIYLVDGATKRLQLQGNLYVEGVDSVQRASNQLTITTASAHSFVGQTYVSLFDVTGFSTNPEGAYVVQSVTSNTIVVDQVGPDEPLQAQNNLTCGVAKTFEPVTTTVTTSTSDDDVSMTVVGGLGTVSATAHGRAENDVLTVYDGGGSGLVEGDRYTINYIDADSYSIRAEIPDGTYTITLGGKQPIGGGYVAMPEADWGLIHENRMVLKYGDDEIIYSDIFDYETFDPIVNQLRFGTDNDDDVVAYVPLTADRAIVLCKKSVHLVVGIAGSLLDIQRYEITREFGCLSGRTAIYANGMLMFLSRKGVVTIRINEGYELFVDPVPLSEPVQEDMKPFLLDLAFGSTENSFAVFHDNRYYLFANDNAGGYPDTVFVYNFLNGGWESKDTYPVNFTDAVVCDTEITAQPYGVFAADNAGNVYLMEADSKKNDDTESSTSAIAGTLKTRGLQYGSMNVKRFTRAIVIFDKDADSGQATISSITTDPDRVTQIYQASPTVSEETTVRARIGDRGRSVQLQVQSGDTRVTGFEVDAIVSSTNDVTRV